MINPTVTTPPPSDEARRTFHTLDLLRGVAAVAVVGRHLNGVYLAWLPGSHLAVDLFFVLSGFVIAHAYAARLDAGLRASAFMRIRLIRLYPLYLLGSVMGIAVTALTALIGTPGTAGVETWAGAIALALLFLPAPFFNHFQLYPFNSVSWSLIWELVANALYALIAPRLTNKWLGGGLAIGAALIVISSAQFDGLSSGSTVFNWIGGPQRVGYSFLAGIALHRLWSARVMAWLRIPPLLSVAILLAVFALRPTDAAPVFDAVAVLIVFPVLVLGSTVEPAPRLRPVAARLGLASYAVYALHPPLLMVYNSVLSRTGSVPSNMKLAVETGFIVLVVAAALLANRWYDQPVRAWLSRRQTNRCRVAPRVPRHPAAGR